MSSRGGNSDQAPSGFLYTGTDFKYEGSAVVSSSRPKGFTSSSHPSGAGAHRSQTPTGPADTLWLTFLDARGLAALAFLPPFLPDVAFLPLFSGGGERIVSDLPLVPRFLASSSGWILGRTPPLAMVTPFSS